MRLLSILVAGILACVLLGCGGGGGQPFTEERRQLTVTYFHWVITLPQAGGTAQEYFQASAQLWQPQDAALLSNPLLSLASASATVALAGPSLISPTDGTNQTGAPIDVYWGIGETIPTGQPKTALPGDWKPGYIRPSDDLYFYAGSADFEEAARIGGVYTFSQQGMAEQTWTAPEGTEMLPAANITAPMAIAVNSLRPLRVAWDAVHGAAGYLVNIEGTKKDQDNNLLRTVVWTSAERPMVFDAVYDLTDDLLPATTREVTVPARVFRGCEALQINVFAQAEPIVDTTTHPTFRLLNGSRGMKIAVVFEQ